VGAAPAGVATAHTRPRARGASRRRSTAGYSTAAGLAPSARRQVQLGQAFDAADVLDGAVHGRRPSIQDVDAIDHVGDEAGTLLDEEHGHAALVDLAQAL